MCRWRSSGILSLNSSATEYQTTTLLLWNFISRLIHFSSKAYCFQLPSSAASLSASILKVSTFRKPSKEPFYQPELREIVLIIFHRQTIKWDNLLISVPRLFSLIYGLSGEIKIICVIKQTSVILCSHRRFKVYNVIPETQICWSPARLTDPRDIFVKWCNN